MTSAELKSYYPLVPLMVLDKYAKYFAMNIETSKEFIGYSAEYSEKCVLNFSARISNGQQIAFTAFNPSQSFVSVVDARPSVGVENQFIKYFEQGLRQEYAFSEPYNSIELYANLNLVCDSRLGSFSIPFISASVVSEFSAGGGLGSISKQNGFRTYFGQVWAYEYAIYVAANFRPYQFNGLASAIIAAENGIALTDFNYTDAIQAKSFINAVSKYSAEIQNANYATEKKAQYEINDVMREAKSAMSRDLADLEQKKIAIMLSIKNEENSALRDMQNLLINIQAIKV